MMVPLQLLPNSIATGDGFKSEGDKKAGKELCVGPLFYLYGVVSLPIDTNARKRCEKVSTVAEIRALADTSKQSKELSRLRKVLKLSNYNNTQLDDQASLDGVIDKLFDMFVMGVVCRMTAVPGIYYVPWDSFQKLRDAQGRNTDVQEIRGMSLNHEALTNLFHGRFKEQFASFAEQFTCYSLRLVAFMSTIDLTLVGDSPESDFYDRFREDFEGYVIPHEKSVLERTKAVLQELKFPTVLNQLVQEFVASSDLFGQIRMCDYTTFCKIGPHHKVSRNPNLPKASTNPNLQWR